MRPELGLNHQPTDTAHFPAGVARGFTGCERVPVVTQLLLRNVAVDNWKQNRGAHSGRARNCLSSRPNT
jgi:hypothetical protein